MNEKMIEMRNIEVKFKVRDRDLVAIRNVRLEIDKCETLTIVGESGSVKYVLSHTLPGLIAAHV